MAIPVPVEPNETLYIRNLNERASIPDLTATLQTVFSHFGSVVDIIAKSSVQRKGQAFVVFDTVENARKAREVLDGFDVFEQPMRVDFARTKSDATVQKAGGEALEQWKRKRKEEKERKQAASAASQVKRPAAGAITDAATSRPSKTARTGAKGAASAVVPDEYLPPNKVLYLQNVPEEFDEDALQGLFARYSGFREVRMVPGRRGIAFVEYENEENAITAKNNMANYPLPEGGKMLKVTYQRQMA